MRSQCRVSQSETHSAAPRRAARVGPFAHEGRVEPHGRER